MKRKGVARERMKSRDKMWDSKYDSFVEHPLYGRYPRHTGLNPNPYESDVQLHWNATNIHEIQKRVQRILGKKLGFLSGLESITPRELPRIAGTAINADPAKQNMPTVPVTRYYDVEKVCRNCQRSFIFFAEEQRYWYEKLCFPLHAGCVRCPECRKTERFLARCRATYEKLSADSNRSWEENLKMAECALTLVEQGVFQRKVVQKIRALMKTVPESARESKRTQNMLQRLKATSSQEHC